MSQKFLTPILSGEMELVLEDMEELFQRKDDDEAVRHALIRNIHMTEEDLSHMRFLAVVFENCTFQDCSFERGEFSDVIFRSCDISNCNFSDSYFNRMEFHDSKGIGTTFSGSTFLYLSAANCNFDYANFDASKFEHIRFGESQFRGGFFTQCHLKDVKWDKIVFEKASFFKTSLKGMDFTTSSIQGLLLSDDGREINGAVVDLYQAAELSRYLGVVIKE